MTVREGGGRQRGQALSLSVPTPPAKGAKIEKAAWYRLTILEEDG
jgi:hypothetical protein